MVVLVKLDGKKPLAIESTNQDHTDLVLKPDLHKILERFAGRCIRRIRIVV